MTTEIKPRPHELVQDPDYFRDVMRNMEWVPGKENRRVRFGTTGEGHFPNYQTGWPADHVMAHEVHRFSGRTHSAYHDAPLETFDEDRLSRAFTWEEVTGMLAGRLPPKK
ncbi:hypothetical protein [Methylobacterium sp. WL7]|uniref:hypothetical protein n=1 Tax=Methylobacterium sp. WL7 TaxID=2603900 RepID=UPI0011C8A016|nr:hypothetical protein [Methylobacterium sp. WL7]TXN42377.1 hypothetical protein FV233_23105 [Methylobacterium sp. WL7]